MSSLASLPRRRPPISPLFLTALALLLFPGVALALGGTGAPPINEAAVTVTLHVNPSAASGGNGSSASPFNTLQAALNRAINTHNAANQGVRVLLAPGTYREGTPGATNAVTLPSPATAAPVIIEGAGWSAASPNNTGDVILSGSENWSGGWSAQGDGTWTRAWPYAWGVGPNNTGGGNPPEAMLRYELVHVNGATYYQMLGPTDPNLAHLTATEGAFWVNESTATLTVRPPASLADLNTALVEVTTKRRLLHHWRPQATTTPTNVVLRNLVFQHAASGLNSGAVLLQNLIGLHVEDCVFRDNKQTGVSITGIRSTFTVRRTALIRNGEMGSGFQGVNILAEDVRWSDNSRFADVIKYYGWGYGGIKIGESSNLTFRRIEAARNYGMGLWFDTGNVNCLVEDSVIVDNTSQGVWSENNNRNNIAALGATPTVVLRRVYLAGNYRRSPQATVTGGGFYITEAENSRIEHSVLYDNTIQFRISDGPGRGPVANTTVRSSVLASRQGQVQRLYAVGYGTTGWQQFFDTLSSATGNNDYYYSGSTDGVTALSPQPQPATTVAFYTRDQQLTQTLAQWKTLHASRSADQDSRWLTTYSGQPLVTIEPAAAYRQESGGTVAGFILRRVARDFSTPLAVSLTAAGNASPGVHHQAFPTSVVMPAGARALTVPFTPLLSGQTYGELTVGLAVAPSAAYVAPDPIASFLLEDTASAGQPRVSVAASTPLASEEGPTPGEFTFTRTGGTTSALTVNYTLGGTAASSRYQALSGQASFVAGSATATVVVTPIDDTVPQLSQTITLTVVSGSGYIPSVSDPVTATVTLRDNDIVESVSAFLPPGNTSTTVPVTLRNPATVAQTFTVSLPGNSSSAYVMDDSTQSDGPPYHWIEISGGAGGSTRITSLDGVDDALSSSLNLGFNFPFFGGSYASLSASSNGVLYFGTGNHGAAWSNTALPSNSLVNAQSGVAALPFYWDDLRFLSASSAWFSRPDADTLILQFQDVRHYSDTTKRITAQVVLKSSGEIIIAYKDITIPYNLGSTIGLQGTLAEGQPSVQASFNNDYVRSGMSLRFRRPVRWLSASQNSFQVVVPAGGSAAFDLTFAATGLALGSHAATITITSDHPEQPVIALPVSLTIAAGTPPFFTDPAPLALFAGQPFSRLVRIDQEIRAFFDTPAADTYPGAAGEGWLGPWTLRATSIDTTASASLVSDNPIQDSGPRALLAATAGGAAKRAFLTRSYGDDSARRITRTAPHRIALELRPDDLSGFSSTNDRLYLWDRPTPSNVDHLNADMTWAFLTTGTPREWRYYAGTSQTATGVRLVEGHAYRFIIEVEPVQRRWRFTLRDLGWQSGDPGTPSHASAWVAFRNAATGAASVGGHLHIGAFLDSFPQTARVSLDSVRITAADLSFAAENLPAGFAFDPEMGRLTAAVESGSGAVTLGVITPDGTTWRDHPYAVPAGYEAWLLDHTWPEPVETTTAPDADPDADGLPNLLEYALALDPLSAAATGAGMPALAPNLSHTHLTLSFLRARADLTYEVLASSDLMTWQVVATNPGQVSLTAPVTVEDLEPAAPRRFLRLRVSR